MNAVEIEEAISALAEQPFEPEEFPFAFLQAFSMGGNLRDPIFAVMDMRGGALATVEVSVNIGYGYDICGGSPVSRELRR